jgi:glucose uptake protein GlcU
MVNSNNKMSEVGLCFLVVLAISIAMIIYGFSMVLRRRESNERDEDVVQRQLRGFGYLLLSQLVLVVGSAICVGMNMDVFSKMVKSVRM